MTEGDSMSDEGRIQGLTGEVCRRYGVNMCDVRGPNPRGAPLAARRAIAWLLRQQGWSTPDIGGFLDRDHSSILHGLKPEVYAPPDWLLRLSETVSGGPTKVCGNCAERLPVGLFHLSDDGTGLSAWCRPCVDLWRRCPRLPGPLALAVHQIAEASERTFDDVVLAAVRQAVDRARANRDLRAAV